MSEPRTGPGLPADHDGTEEADEADAQASQGPSGVGGPEELGGADAVSSTPDNVPAEDDPDGQARRRGRWLG
ncbi:MAG TPA: hypothetical protein VFP34_19890 [Microlunatus sp.]|nr:hypothetical protein [Microlunatus sp.]